MVYLLLISSEILRRAGNVSIRDGGIGFGVATPTWVITFYGCFTSYKSLAGRSSWSSLTPVPLCLFHLCLTGCASDDDLLCLAKDFLI